MGIERLRNPELEHMDLANCRLGPPKPQQECVRPRISKRRSRSKPYLNRQRSLAALFQKWNNAVEYSGKNMIQSDCGRVGKQFHPLWFMLAVRTFVYQIRGNGLHETDCEASAA